MTGSVEVRGRRIRGKHDYVAPPPPPVSPPNPVYAMYGAAADHVTSKVVYNGLVIAGNQYPFIDVASGVTTSARAVSVEWRLDLPLTQPGILRTDAPYFDFGGINVNGVVPWNTNTVSGTTAAPVNHTLTALVTLSDGSTQLLTGTNSVQNVAASGAFHTLSDVLFDFREAPFRTDNTGWNLFGAHIKIPNGVPFGWDWREGARHFVHPGPRSNMWWVCSDPTGGGGLHDCRLQLRRYRFNVALNSGGVVSYVNRGATDGTPTNGQYVSNPRLGAPGAGVLGGFTLPNALRSESVALGGGMSVALSYLSGSMSGYEVDAAHCWPDLGFGINVADAIAVYATMQARIIHDVAANADLAAADFYLWMGTDAINSSNVNIGGPANTRAEKVNYQGNGPYDGWHTFTCCLLTPAGCTFMGIPTSPTHDQHSNAIKAFLQAHPPTLDTYP